MCAMGLHVDSTTGKGDMDAVARCKRVLELMLTNRGNPSCEAERVLSEDPELVFGHCLRAALIVRADDFTARSKVVASVTAIETICPDINDPARRHASAARAWLDGDQALAVERYGAILIDRPRDILALVVANAIDFRLGQRRMLRDRVAQVISEWESTAPGYASVLAMYAFGLEENGQYRRAEKIARRALALDPRHPGAIHVIAHVMEMQGRAREGLEFLAATEFCMDGHDKHLCPSGLASRAVPPGRGRSKVRARSLRCADRQHAGLGHVGACRCFCIAMALTASKYSGGRTLAGIG